MPAKTFCGRSWLHHSHVPASADLSSYFLEKAPDSLRLALVEALLAYVQQKAHCPNCADALVWRIVERGSGIEGLILLASELGESHP